MRTSNLVRHLAMTGFEYFERRTDYQNEIRPKGTPAREFQSLDTDQIMCFGTMSTESYADCRFVMNKDQLSPSLKARIAGIFGYVGYIDRRVGYYRNFFGNRYYPTRDPLTRASFSSAVDVYSPVKIKKGEKVSFLSPYYADEGGFGGTEFYFKQFLYTVVEAHQAALENVQLFTQRFLR